MNMLTVLLACLCGVSQAPLPALRIEAIPEGSILIIRNVHSAPLTGVLVEMVGYPGGTFRFLHDDVEGEAIAPGAERRFQVRSMLAGVAPDYMKLQAAVYQDGSVTGATAKIEQILAERRSRLKAIRESIERLGEKGSQEALEKLRKSERALTGSKPSLF